jgi:hypothetical protein
MLNQLSNESTVNMKTELDCMIGEILMTCLETNNDISNILHLSNGYENSEFVEDLHKSYLIGNRKFDLQTTFRCETQLCTDDDETYILYGFIKDLSTDMEFSEFPLTTISDFADHFKNELNKFIQMNLR